MARYSVSMFSRQSNFSRANPRLCRGTTRVWQFRENSEAALRSELLRVTKKEASWETPRA